MTQNLCDGSGWVSISQTGNWALANPPTELSGGERHRRQINRKARSLADLRVDVQGASGLLDEALDDVQSQAGALPRAFGRKIGLEDLRQSLRRNPGSVVADADHQERRGVVEALDVQQAGPADRL